MKNEVNMDVVDFVSRLMTLVFRVGLFIGGSSLLFYCYRLQFFPAGLSVGDGFLLLILAVSFGFIYILFVVSLFSLGLWLTPAFRVIQWVVLRCVGIVRKNGRLPKPVEFASPDFGAFAFGLFGIAFIYSISKAGPVSLMHIVGTCVLLGLLGAAYKDISLKLSAATKGGRRIGFAVGPIDFVDEAKLFRFKYLLLLFIFVLPLAMSGVSGILLEAGMRLSSLSRGDSRIYLMAPYSEILPSSLLVTVGKGVSGYTEFSPVDVLFYGIGDEVVIGFRVDGAKQKLVVPEKFILVAPPVKKGGRKKGVRDNL